MTVSIVPLRFKNLTPDDREERLQRVDMTILEYGEALGSKHLTSPDELDQFLSSNGTISEPMGRLLIVQDLSTCMIEKLGAAFDIEPGFFRSHIGDYVWLNTRDPTSRDSGPGSFFMEIKLLQQSLGKARKQAGSFNVLRRIDHDERFKPWTDVPGSDVGLVRSKASLWVRPSKSDDKGWLGILLVDLIISHGFPLWAGYGSFLPPPGMGTSEVQENMPSPLYEGTAIQEFLYWTLNQAHSKPNVPPLIPNLLPLAFFTMICAHWIILCEYVNTSLGQIEYEIELGLSHLYSHDFDHTVKALLKWRRHMPIYHSFVERAISRISVRYALTENTGPFDSWEDTLINLRDILHRLENLHCRADKIMTVAMAVTAREESKRATQESHAVTRVSYLAFIFVPLGFLSSVFNMNSEFPVRTYWIYAAIALPVSALALVALMFAESIAKWTR